MRYVCTNDTYAVQTGIDAHASREDAALLTLVVHQDTNSSNWIRPSPEVSRISTALFSSSSENVMPSWRLRSTPQFWQEVNHRSAKVWCHRSACSTLLKMRTADMNSLLMIHAFCAQEDTCAHLC